MSVQLPVYAIGLSHGMASTEATHPLAHLGFSVAERECTLSEQEHLTRGPENRESSDAPASIRLRRATSSSSLRLARQRSLACSLRWPSVARRRGIVPGNIRERLFHSPDDNEGD